MTSHSQVSRKDVGEDRIAICPIFGCESMTRVKPLKFGFFGFGKYPKCKKHYVPLVYVDECIGEFVDGALACLFDKAGLPSGELISMVASKYPNEVQSFLHGWVYCITTGRGAPIVSRYLDSISKTYLKKLKRKQVKVFKKEGSGKHVGEYQALKDGYKALTTHYARFLKHLRVHSEVLVDTKILKSLSSALRHDLKKWQDGIIKNYLNTSPFEKGGLKNLEEIKQYYDHILNVGTCQSLIGMNAEIKKIKVTAFDRFSSYTEFFFEGITDKFTRSDLKKLEPTKQLNKYLYSNDSDLENKGNVSSSNPNKNHFCGKVNKNLQRSLDNAGSAELEPDEEKSSSKSSIPTKLKEKIIKFALNRLKPFSLHNLEESEIFNFRDTLEILATNFIEPQIPQKDLKFKELLTKYLSGIIFTLINIKTAIETNQKINMSEIAKESHDVSIPYNQWYKNVKYTVNYVRNNYDFNLRTLRNDSISISEPTKNQIRSYKNFYDLIRGKDRKGITIQYLDIDYSSEIKISYDGKCYGHKGNFYCDFQVDYKFLPCLGFHHLLEYYNRRVKNIDHRYIAPKDLNCYSFDKAIELMQTQVGGLSLICSNCHSLKHSTRYTFSPIFEFLKLLTFEEVNKNAGIILKEAKKLASRFLQENEVNYDINRTNTKAKVKTEIYRAIKGYIKKKYVIEYLFGTKYVCPICQKANINDHLVCFDAHHTNIDLLKKIGKIEFGREYGRKSIPWLIKNVIMQECIFICSNCHAMINATTYRDFSLNILKNKKDADHIKAFYDKLDEKVRIKRKKILEFKNISEFPNPLQIIFSYGKALDEKLVCIYYLCQKFSKEDERGLFSAKVFNFVLDKYHTHFNNYKDELLENDYIQYLDGKNQFNQKFFIITPVGIKKAKQIIKNKFSSDPVKFQKLIKKWNKRYLEVVQ